MVAVGMQCNCGNFCALRSALVKYMTINRSANSFDIELKKMLDATIHGIDNLPRASARFYNALDIICTSYHHIRLCGATELKLSLQQG